MTDINSRGVIWLKEGGVENKYIAAQAVVVLAADGTITNGSSGGGGGGGGNPKATTATRYAIPANTVEANLISSNINRKKIFLKNTSTTLTWYLIYGATPGSSQNYTLDLLPGDSYIETDYTGPIRGVCSGATAATLLLTELV